MKPVSLSGAVTQFKGNGRKLGYPTANIKVHTDLQDGVYFGYADLANWKHQPALVFIGTPTTMGDTDRRIEAHLLDIPDEDYYGQRISISLEYFHRANQKFDRIEDLLKAMRGDEKTA